MDLYINVFNIKQADKEHQFRLKDRYLNNINLIL